MRYINIIKIIVLGSLLSFALSACSDWLEVDPKDKILEDKVYSSELAIQEALNGIYLNMAAANSYGSELTGRTLGLVAQEFYVTTAVENEDAMKYHLAYYNYNETSARNKINDIWSKGYNIILSINTFISRLEATENSSIIIPSRKNILLGEAYGLRAFIHLDLLRMFGPVYLTDSTGLAIPYHTNAEVEYLPRIVATEVMDKIMTDINTSSTLLNDDPVRTEGPMNVADEGADLTESQKAIDSFYRKRNQRMNYYAVQALKVRTLMYRNNKPAAAAVAKSLVNGSGLDEKFPWTAYSAVFNTSREDRIFSSEVLFGIYSYNMYSHYTSYYSSGITNQYSIYATALKNLEATFDAASGTFSQMPDVRSKFWIDWTSPMITDGGEKRMATLKFMRSTYGTTATFFQPLIRKSELYYALAEAEENVAYLDEVRVNRNIKTVAEQKPTFDLNTEITNEYMREFRGEGQLFFYYKRKFMTPIMNGVPSTTGTAKLTMTKEKYIFPIPQAEFD